MNRIFAEVVFLNLAAWITPDTLLKALAFIATILTIYDRYLSIKKNKKV